jgi:hypothetical protein
MKEWDQALQSVEDVQRHLSGSVDVFDTLTGQKKAALSRSTEAFDVLAITCPHCATH